ncbi:ubiquinone biosynthesis protein [Hydrogenovibrio sp. SC-1]|uniref:UbiH/UbiF/VisC/COQ6 family ubiquinone biosynthesis hydroxylase n=1 Tax=Hydrogenovibrio sp. SC-1 TaxID=2065820 RepID=UPI000C7E031E|nr:UbiH/UbiF/VisC/COQ6 family ubiquinone biosynthesis hydroxylase [Hydrogenovibrio sp. SC-1]PLA75474.1 ubiquinone biosynthesis protein [Hydrogenovibrio sp. SC-1]
MTNNHSKASSSPVEIAEKAGWDVIVVGGGMVGATAALGLAQQQFNVLLLEQYEPDLSWSTQQPYQVRVSALTRASENILKALGAWPGIEARRCHAFTDMHVWESSSEAEVHFSAADIHQANLGHVVENSVIQAALWEQLLAHPSVTIRTGDEVVDLSLTSQGAEVFLSNGESLLTQLVVGADGAASKTRQLAGIELTTHDYHQCAVVGCVETELSHQNTCWQRYQADGPFAFLAMPDNQSSIAWYLPIEKMQWALALSDEAFAEAITEASANKLGQVIKVGERGAFPLIRRHANHYIQPHFVLIGDAAHTVHPQAGQGVNLGLLDAAALIDTLANARQQAPEKDWSRRSVLRRYERWRRGDNVIVQRSMEGFDWMFQQDQSVKNKLRSKILPLANQATPIKNWLMSQVLKGREVLPSLAQ